MCTHRALQLCGMQFEYMHALLLGARLPTCTRQLGQYSYGARWPDMLFVFHTGRAILRVACAWVRRFVFPGLPDPCTECVLVVGSPWFAPSSSLVGKNKNILKGARRCTRRCSRGLPRRRRSRSQEQRNRRRSRRRRQRHRRRSSWQQHRRRSSWQHNRRRSSRQRHRRRSSLHRAVRLAGCRQRFPVGSAGQ